MQSGFVAGAEQLLALGRDVGDVGVAAMVLRTIAIYAFTLTVVRVASSRLLSKATPFDFIVSILLGSIMSSAINGSAPFVPTLGAGATLLCMHWLFAQVAVHTGWFGVLVKGSRIMVIEDGQVLEDGLREASMTRADLKQALRLEVNHDDPSRIRSAHLERNGDISIVPYRREPRVVDVAVEGDVQIVRIDLG
jgi:uncharacterized membrane protein YcaP (DUF421 family)